MLIQLRQDDSGFHADGSRLHVQLQNPPHVLGKINLDSGADGLPALGCAATSGGDGDSLSAAEVHGPNHVVGRSWDDHADRHDLIDAGVGGIHASGHRVEADLTLEGAFQRLLEGGELPRLALEGGSPPSLWP